MAGEDPCSDTGRLDALHGLGFQLVEGESIWRCRRGQPCRCRRRRRREGILAGCASRRAGIARAAFRRRGSADASGRFYAQWIENAVARNFEIISA
ncbi:hypothetical protein LAD77_01310 [Klebsiella pneumoniae]|nr:hypothetical protein [Klebsiella pneumoniae]